MFSFFKSTGKDAHAFTIAFYNLENLFDTKNDPKTFDDDFTPQGKNKWNFKRYRKKILKLGNVLSQIGKKKSIHPPALIGVVEIENLNTLNDLINSKHLKNENYGIVHYDSPDERGIDVALLYKKELFELKTTECFPLFLENKKGTRDYTRDVLLVKGKLNGELIYILVNHWPSRGEAKSENKRIKAAKLNRQIIDKIRLETEDPKIIIMGDFNDDPTNVSIKTHLVQHDFYNPMERLINTGKGTLTHLHKWHLFDQIIFSNNFLSVDENKHTFKYAEVFDKIFLQEYFGKYKGTPFRTYIGKWYQGGYSDHFPVYIYLKKH